MSAQRGPMIVNKSVVTLMGHMSVSAEMGIDCLWMGVTAQV